LKNKIELNYYLIVIRLRSKTIFKSFLVSFIFFPLFLTPQVQALVKITEVMPYPAEGPEWVEIYNDSTQSADLSGWKIDDCLDSGQGAVEICQGKIGKPAQSISLKLDANQTCSIELGQGFLNNDKDEVNLINSKEELVDRTEYNSTSNKGKSWQKTENGWVLASPSKEDPCPTLTPTLTPTTRPSPTSTPSPQPSPSPLPSPTSASTATPTSPPPPSATPTPFARLIIGQPQDESGNNLANVKVYLDDIYLHCYAPEELIFCSRCQCQTSRGRYGNCDFGRHTLKLTKAGYQDWQREIEITPGENQTLTVRLTKVNPTATSSPSPTPTPSQPNLEVSPEATSRGLVLGHQIQSPASPSPIKLASESAEESLSLVAPSLIIFGLTFTLGPILFPYLDKKFKASRN